MLVCAGEVAGPHGHERDAADSCAQAAPQAPARQGVLPSRGRKVSSCIFANIFAKVKDFAKTWKILAVLSFCHRSFNFC